MDNCIFCMIANGQIPSTTVYEDDDFKAVFDIAPANPGHVLIIPKKHAGDITELPQETAAKVLPLAARIGKAQMEALGADGFNTVINTGEAAGQSVMHFHTHIIPRYKGEAPMVANWLQKSYKDGEAGAIAAKLREKL